MTNKYVAYITIPSRKNRAQVIFSNQALVEQEKRIQEFLTQFPDGVLLKSFIESGDNQRYRHRWPQLSEAVNFCLEQQAHLIIGEIRNLTNNDAFTAEIFRLFTAPSTGFVAQFHCCDQPSLKKENFSTIVEHAREQKELHGQKIKDGLSRTTAKSGNPHASAVITRVNEPKIKSAIWFALMLGPVIAQYRDIKHYSQRKMVNALNEEHFTAPEGGPWVLSQFQKVYDRIKMNELALQLEHTLREYRANHHNSATIAELLQKAVIKGPSDKGWTPELVEKIEERIAQIHEITRLNEFVIQLIPILEKYHTDELTEDVFANELQLAGIALPDQENSECAVMLNRVKKTMECAEKWRLFQNNPHYQPFLANALKVEALANLAALSETSETFLTPSYEFKENRRKFN